MFDEHFLMSVSTIGAFVIGEYPEAVAVMLFYQVGEFFQSLAVERSRKSISDLMDKKLCDRLKQAGFFVDLKEYSNTMMLSRVVSGKYDVFLASDDFIDVTTLTQMDYMIMDNEEMR